MINEKTIQMILTWLDEKVTDAGKRLEAEIEKDNKANHDHFRGREVAYGNVTTFIKNLTGVKLKDIKKESPE